MSEANLTSESEAINSSVTHWLMLLPSGRSRVGNGGVQLRWETHIELAGKLLAGLDAIFLAHLEKDFQRKRTLLPEAGNVLGIEVGASVEADNSPRNISISDRIE